MTFYAKALDGLEGTYEYHVRTCMEIASEFLRINREALEKVCSCLEVSYEELTALCLRAVFFHDAGKLGDFFQGRMRRRLGSDGKDDPKLFFVMNCSPPVSFTRFGTGRRGCFLMMSGLSWDITKSWIAPGLHLSERGIPQSPTG